MQQARGCDGVYGYAPFPPLKMYLPDSAFCLDLLNGKASSIFVGNAFMHSAALPLQIGRVNGKTSKCLGKNLSTNCGGRPSFRNGYIRSLRILNCVNNKIAESSRYAHYLLCLSVYLSYLVLYLSATVGEACPIPTMGASVHFQKHYQAELLLMP